MANWEAIRNLDEEENWSERNMVLSKEDHLDLMKAARVIVEDLVDTLPIPGSQDTEFAYMKEFTDDDFKYSAAQFDVDYLENISSEATSDPSELARKSLFVKFDPLVGKQSPRGKIAPGTVNRAKLLPKSEGDLLLLGTPPQPSHTSEIKTAPPSSQASLFSPGPATVATDSHLTGQPETAELVDVLKYSEDDLPEILVAARRAQRDTETEMYECRIKALREKISHTRQRLQQNNKKKDTFQARTVLQNTANEKIEQDLSIHRERLKSHLQRESDLQSKHEELKKDVAELNDQLELITRDSNSLENAFDKLHQRYVKQKAVHQSLSERNKVLQHYMAELKAWAQEDMKGKQEIQAELQAVEQRADETVETMRKEHTSRMTVERAKALKMKMEMDNLEKAFKQKEEEKLQVSQICDELMRELETVQKIG